ncbi:MAG: PHP domain-containing protein [Mogibacterium sp.]|nr:PHP domain-containing protein [Mogibacterium sp.]
MKQNFDLHMHTTYCDGLNTAEEMIMSAIDKGLSVVGLSGHSFTPHDTCYCMSREGTLQYIDEVKQLREKYEGRIKVLLGLEMDYYADTDTTPYDYIIGSVHYLFTEKGREKRDSILSGRTSDDRSATDAAVLALQKWTDWTAVDDEPYDLRRFALTQDMDMMSVAKLFYETAGSVISQTDCDFIGHFDLLTKFNERFRLRPEETVIDTDKETAPAGAVEFFDTSDPEYVAAWKNAIDRIFSECEERYRRGYRNKLETLGILEAGEKPVFEINTGAISKGYRTTPYPAPDQRDYIRSKGGILILSSDSHRTDTICCGFDEYDSLRTDASSQ